MKLGITGSRTIEEFDFVPYFTLQDKKFRAFCREHGFGRRKITHVISGGAKGVDTIAFRTAEASGIRNIRFLPDREKFPGKMIFRAFQERNREIVDHCDILLAVWNGRSHGTGNTLAYANEIKKPVFVIKTAVRRRRKRGKNGIDRSGRKQV